jgi:hypothetical protein
LIEEERIVLLELNPAGGPGSTVGRILEFSVKLGIQLRHKSVGAFQPTLHDCELCGIPPCFNPAEGPEIMSVHMELLLWTEDILKRGKRLFDQIFKNTVR